MTKIKSRIRVTRTLVYEGSPDWVQRTMNRSACKLNEPYRILDNTITEIGRKEEVIEEVVEKSTDELSKSELKEEIE